MTELIDVKKVFGAVLQDLLDAGRPVMAVDADMRRLSWTGDAGAKHPGAFVQVGIAEQNAVGVAAGLASMGNTVFFATFAGFMASRASDQVLNGVCYNDLDVKLLGTYAGVTSGVNGGTHISVEDTAVFRAMPTMRVADPVDGHELERVIRTAVETPGPVYIRVPRGPLPTLPGLPPGFAWGKGVVLREGGDVALITSGIASYEGALAAAKLAEEGLSINHVHMPSIKPIDEDLIADIAKKSRIIFTAENHSVIGGLGSAVCEIVAARAPVRVVRLGIGDTFCEGMTEKELVDRHGFSAGRLVSAVREGAAKN